MAQFKTTRRGLIGATGAGLAAGLAGVGPAKAANACGGISREEYQVYLDRFNNSDPSFIEFYHDDVELELGNATINGATAIRDFYKEVHAHIHETVEVTHFISDANGIAVELPSEFICYKDWKDGYFQRDLKAGEAFRVISFGLYWVEDGKFRKIKAARYKLVNDWQMES